MFFCHYIGNVIAMSNNFLTFSYQEIYLKAFSTSSIFLGDQVPHYSGV
jgi:hypothetical protein